MQPRGSIAVFLYFDKKCRNFANSIDKQTIIIYNFGIRVEAHRTKSTSPQKAAQPLVSERGALPKPAAGAAAMVGRTE